MTWRSPASRLLGVAVVAVSAATSLAAMGGAPHPLGPASLDRDDIARVDLGEPIVNVLPATGRDVSVVGAARVRIEPERLVAWVSRVDHLHPKQYVPIAVKFSSPPRIEDLGALVLDNDDLDDLRSCRPGDCGVKLTAAEIGKLRRVLDSSGAGWRQALQQAFRELMLDRARMFLAGGFARLDDFADHKRAISPAAEFTAALAGIEIPQASDPSVESFLYWSKETPGGMKSIVSMTQVTIARSVEPQKPAVVIASTQFFATHYFTAALSLTALLRPSGSAPGYLVYLQRSRADLLEGTFGGLVRKVAERRIRSEAPGILGKLRERLEGGDPPADGATRLASLAR